MSNKKKLIAMLGGGQLGLMFTEKAQSMGEKILVLDPDKNCPAGKIANKFINAEYTDKNALQSIINECDVCTTEFENIPYKTLKTLENKIEVYPSSQSLKITQNRSLEKKFLKSSNIPTTKYYEINSSEDLNLLNHINDWPYILKTSAFGYDGKGQSVINNFNDLVIAYNDTGVTNYVLEKKVKLYKEVSQVAACYKNKIIFLPISENIHINNILHKSLVPAKITLDSENVIRDISKKIIHSLNYEGIICIEFFIDNDNNILVNEIAPRTHNSGHYSIEGCDISQFEHQVKILTKQEPKCSSLKSSTVMINLLGDLWLNSTPNFIPTDKENIFLHLYNKDIAKPGRKMGHITVIDKSIASAEKIADKLFNSLI
jgi:5-(carboxyamino)imidazole ribonucleotide synthase